MGARQSGHRSGSAYLVMSQLTHLRVPDGRVHRLKIG
jgi:hypothetical protein